MNTPNTYPLSPLDALKSFCGGARCDDDPRPYVRQLITDGIYAYGTDGWAVLSVPVETLPADTRLAPVEDSWPTTIRNLQALIIAAREAGGELVEPPTIPDPTPCNKCDGTGLGHGQEPCPECDEEGEFYYGSHWYDCLEFGGTGQHDTPNAPKSTAPCSQCLGLGEQTYNPIKIAEAYINRVFLARIVALPNARIAQPRSPNTAVYFSCAFGDGAVMPTHYEENRYTAAPTP